MAKTGNAISGSLLEFARNCDQGLSIAQTGTDTTDLPSSDFYQTCFILRRANDISILAVSHGTKNIYKRSFDGTSWGSWHSWVTNTDLVGKTGSFGWTLGLCTIQNAKVIERAGYVSIHIYATRSTAIGDANTEITLGTITGVTLPAFAIRGNAATGPGISSCINNAYVDLGTTGKINLRTQNSTDKAFVVNLFYPT